jgi:hypothetical protein
LPVAMMKSLFSLAAAVAVFRTYASPNANGVRSSS